MRMAIGIAIRFEPVIESACDIEVLKINQRQALCQGAGDPCDLVPRQDSGSCVYAVAPVADIGSEIRPHQQQAEDASTQPAATNESTPCAIDSASLIHTMLLPFRFACYRSLF